MKTVIGWCLLAFALGATAQERGLVVGDAAPPLDVGRWLYGDSLAGYALGRMYLVEFTHLHCIPCREAIPHLTALQAKYRNSLTVVSVYSYFRNDKLEEAHYASSILALKARMDTLMVYTIAQDTRDAATNASWRGDAGTGFPYALLVDGRGRIAWQGQVRMDEIETVIGQLLSGSFDAENHEAREATFKAEYLPLVRLRKAEITEASVAQAEALLARYPEKEIEIRYLQFNLLLAMDAERASVHLGRLLMRFPEYTFNPETHFVLYQYPGLDWRLGIELVERCQSKAVEPQYQANYLDIKSRIYAYNGAFSEAIATSDEAISLRDDAFGAESAYTQRYRDAREAYRFFLLAQEDPAAADRWLREHVVVGALARDTAALLYYQLNSWLTEAQREMLKSYLFTST